jgi:hypothetical protein
VAGAKSKWSSILRIADPPPDEPETDEAYYLLKTDSVAPVVESMHTVRIVEDLILAGAFDIAKNAFPIETETAGLMTTGEAERSTFKAADHEWIGLVYEFLFPSSLRMPNGNVIVGCRLRFGISDDVNQQLSQHMNTTNSRGLLLSTNTEEGHASAFSPNTEDRYAMIRHGSLFLADLTLL